MPSARPGFLFPVRALAQVFRDRYLAGLRRAFAAGQLRFAGSTAPPAAPAVFTAWLAELRRQAGVFIRRFLLHVVPDRFVRIRHFGLLANRTRKAKLTRCRHLLAVLPAAALRPPESVAAIMLRLTGFDIERCPACHEGRLRIVAILAPMASPAPPVAIIDTS